MSANYYTPFTLLYKDTQTHIVTDANDQPTHGLATASMSNNKQSHQLPM